MDLSELKSSSRAPLFAALLLTLAALAAGCGVSVSDPGASAESAFTGPHIGRTAQALTGAVANGTFETDLSGWTLAGAKLPIRSTLYAHSGAAALRCGATSGSGQKEPKGDSSASQAITVPSDVASAQVSFWAFTTTDDRSGDYQEAELRDPSGAVLETAFHLLSDARTWTYYALDLTPYRGQTVVLGFNVHSDGHTDPTSMWIDDVQFSSTAGGVDAGTDAGTDAGSDGGTVDGGSGEADGGTGGHGALNDGANISVHLTLGLPDDSTASTSNPDHYLSVKPQYVESYDSAYRVSNWVAWELDSSWIGTTDRTDDYRQDDTLPGSLAQASNSDYSYSGYDRGHLCNAQDRSDNVTDMSSTFYLSNMVPQAPNNNRGPWLRLETYERDLAEQGKHLFIYAGPVFDSNPSTIGANRVAVPVATWKVIVVLDDNRPTSASVTDSTRVIAVVMPNDDNRISASDDWTLYRTTVDDVENQTGLDLLSDVDTSVQAVVEAQVDPGS